MENVREKIKNYIMSISLQERKKRELARYKKEIKYLEKMENDEIDLEYFDLKSQYEHKRNILSIFMLTIIVSILMSVWKYFYNFVEMFMKFVTLDHGNDIETAKLMFIISVIITVFITALIMRILISYVEKMHQIYKKLLVVGEIRSRRYK